MVHEVRKITLESGEVLEALDTYRQKNPAFLPEGAIFDLEPSENNILKLQISGKGSVKDVQLKYEDLLGPITGFCVARCMPLPWKSNKTVEFKGDQAILTITVDHRDPGKLDQSALGLTTRTK